MGNIDSTAGGLRELDAFLAHSMRRALAAQALPEWQKQLPETDAAKRIAFHGIAGLLAPHAQSAARWPEPVLEALRSEARLAALWEETHKAALIPLLTRMADMGVQMVLLKGTALAYRHYTDPSTRRRGDTDLLINRDHLGTARSALLQLGFIRRDDPYGLYYQETWLSPKRGEFQHAIDLHWQVADRPVLQAALHPDAFLKAGIPLPRLCEAARAPHPVQMMIQGAFNQAWHQARGFATDDGPVRGGKRLIWSVDYTYLAKGFAPADWSQLVTICEEHQIADIILDALTIARDDLGPEIPNTVIEQLSGQSPSRASAYIKTADGVANFKSDLLAATLPAKLGLIASAALAPRRHLIAKYPAHSHRSTLSLQLRRYRDALKRLRKGTVVK